MARVGTERLVEDAISNEIDEGVRFGVEVVAGE